MNIAVFAFSRRGCSTARNILPCLHSGSIRLFSAERLKQEDFSPIPQPADTFYKEIFHWANAMIFVCACGIAVRHIAPHIHSKQTDPAVVCVDELGQFAIPLLSGHIGGANTLARQIAASLGATAVITTATDINGRFSADAWAAEHNLVIDSLQDAKAVSAAILERDVPLYCDFPIATAYPPGLTAGSSGSLGICISYRRIRPFSRTLRLIPRILHLGIGCRRGIDSSVIRQAVRQVLDLHSLDPRAVCCAASIDLKVQEDGLVQYAAETALPLRFYSSRELAQVPGEFTSSSFVREIAGVDNVCERAAMADAHRLIVKKTAVNGVTVAVAAKYWEVHFA